MQGQDSPAGSRASGNAGSTVSNSDLDELQVHEFVVQVGTSGSMH